jgi:long-chain fatty acid transport protein
MRKVLVAIAFTLLTCSSARATNGMRMIGFGPVQNSMGGVSIALPLDSATVATNPAGLLSVGQRLDLGATYFAPTVKYQATGPIPNVVGSTGSFGSDFGASYIPAVGYAQQLSDRLAVGVGLYGAAGMGVSYAQNLYGGVTKSSYLQARVTPGVAYRVAEGFTAGVTLNVEYAMMSYAAAAGIGMPPRKTAGAMGLGAVLGVQYAVTPTITLGAAYETRSFFQDFSFDIAAHTETPAPSVSIPFPGGTEKLAFDQPAVATIGLAVRPMDGLVLALDGEYLFWSQTNGANQPKISNGQSVMGFNLNWSDQLVLKVGAELAATKEVKVRLGYDYGKSPLDATRAFENIAFPAIAQHHVTAGVGVDFGQWTVNATAVYAPESKTTGANLDQGLASYATTMSQLAVDVGAAYRF